MTRDQDASGAVELLPCPNPWCEGPEREGDFSPAVSQQMFGNWRVSCTSCCMDGPAAKDHDEAIAAWNTRSNPSEQPDKALMPDGAVVAEELIQEMLDNLKHCSLNSGCCHCGDSMDKHADPMFSGHTPVDMGWTAAESWIAKAEAFLTTPTPVEERANAVTHGQVEAAAQPIHAAHMVEVGPLRAWTWEEASKSFYERLAIAALEAGR